MSGVIVLIMGFAVAFNIIVVKMKFDHGRTADAIADLTMLVILGWLFSGSTGGLAMGAVASAILSVFLFFSPPKMDWMESSASKTGHKNLFD